MGKSNFVMDQALLNSLVGLMAAFRRHFQRTLDIDRFLADMAYAGEVIDWLSNEKDPALTQTAQFLRGRMQGGAGSVEAPKAAGPALGKPPAIPKTDEPATSTRYIKGLR
jgi:hypothetical protein